MKPNDFVYTQIYKGALNAGASALSAQQSASTGSDDYRKGRFTRKVSHLIEDKIKEAKKSTKAGL